MLISPAMSSGSEGAVTIQWITHAPRRHSFRVVSKENVTPLMTRITLGGNDLVDFVSISADDHIRIFVPTPKIVERRSLTLRSIDRQARTMTVDIATLSAGPVAKWALDAEPGSVLDALGPQASCVISGVHKWLLIGDETALSAIARRIEEASRRTILTSIVAVTAPEEEQAFTTLAEHEAIWIHRARASSTNPFPLIEVLDGMDIYPETFVWIAGEASFVSAIRMYLSNRRRHPHDRLQTGGYWLLGYADFQQVHSDGNPGLPARPDSESRCDSKRVLLP